jgi:heptosyltransferase-2
VASTLVRTRKATCVLVGSRADSTTTRQIAGYLDTAATSQVIDVTGDTTLEMLAGLLGIAQACVSNDSGAMHLAAAVGTPLVALFGPTNEYETSPLTRHGRQSAVVTHPVWCRPCMLRECPIDHRCMKGITPQRVLDTLTRLTTADAPSSVSGS